MNTYLSTAITGLNEPVIQALQRTLPDVSMILILDGLIVYQTTASQQTIKHLPFLNNSFLLLHLFKQASDISLQHMMQYVTFHPRLFNQVKATIKPYATFRIITSKENQMVAVDKQLVLKLEQQISRILHLRIHRSNPDYEIWFLLRRESYGFFMLRLTRHTDYAKIREKGELRPELATVLCFLSNPQASDVFLDPFAGSGAIPFKRAKLSPYTQITAGDNDKQILNNLRRKNNSSKQPLSVATLNATAMQSIATETIDKIVTDPPWGLYMGKELDLPIFYKAMLNEFYRVLKLNGILVLLIAKKELFAEVLAMFSEELVVLNTYHTLVSGQKATIFKVQKKH